MNYLICNAGSSSIKFSLLEAEHEQLLVDGSIDWSSQPTRFKIRKGQEPEIHSELALTKHGDAIAHVISELPRGEIAAVGHRIVHGGPRYTSAVLVTPDVEREIAKLAELAPLHNPAGVEVIDAVRKILPAVPQVAAFDTAFHATLSAAARTYPVPWRWTTDWGLRRYGFHGLSHAYSAMRAAEMLSNDHLKLIVAHLGNGASVSAILNGICVDTSMGFTPLDGLMMGTRSGSVDPGLLIYLMRHKGLSADQIDHALNHESGLLGVSGVSYDMRDVQAAAAQNNDRAKLAIEIYVHRVQQTIGAMAASLGGVDALVFTAGVGENAPAIRHRIGANLRHLGLCIDATANAACKPDADISAPSSKAKTLVIAAREDLTIVREIKRLVPPKASL